MFDPFSNEDNNLDEAIASAYADLKSFSADEEGYRHALEQISKLYALKNNTAQLNLQAQQSFASHQLDCDKNAWSEEQDEREIPFYERVDPNTLLIVAGNILVGLIVVKYEQTGVISSKVMSFMRKI